MSDNFHNCALIFEFLKFVLLYNFSFDFFDRDYRVLPPASMHNTIATFRKFPIKDKFRIRNLVVLNKCSRFVAEKLLA
jgi:hypothetical protein